MSSQAKKQNALLSFFLLFSVGLVLILFMSCDLNFKFPSFSFGKRDPTKQDVLDDFALKLKSLSGVEARLNGDNIVFSFRTGTTANILTQQVKNAFSQLSSIAEKDTLQIRITSGDVVYSAEVASTQVQTQVMALIATKEVWREEVEYNAMLTYKGYDFELHGDLVFHDLHRILMTDDEWAQLQADNFNNLYRDVLNLTTSTVHFDHISAIFSALSAINSSMPAVKEKLSGQEDSLGSLVKAVYTSPTTTQKQKNTIDQLRNMMGAFIVHRNMVSNDDTVMAIGPIPLKLSGDDVTDRYTFKFKTEKNGYTITTLDLSNGASTFIVYMEASPHGDSGLAPISGDVVIKIGSVSIGSDRDTLYTIEDAIEQAGYNDIFVRYNTSFASADVAEKVYGKTEYRIGSPTTLVLPYDETLSSGIDDVPKTLDENKKEKDTTGGSITRSSEYVRLTIPDGITIDLKGRLLVNAKRAANATKFQGHVTGSNYSVLHLEEKGKINVEYRGELYALGFIEGDGTIEVESGGYVYEGLFISSFRGGTATWNISDEVFPFDQYTVAQIESDVVIKAGGNYIGKSLIWAGERYTSGDFALVGNNAIIRMMSGSVTKTFDTSSGKVTITLDGEGSINNGGVKVGTSTATTNGKAIPFDGTWHFVVKDDSEIDIHSMLALLPGSSLTIEDGAKVTVKYAGQLTVFNPYEYIENDYDKYPSKIFSGNPPVETDYAERYYRKEPTFLYDNDTPARVYNDGLMNINGSIAGKVGGSGTVDISTNDSQSYKFWYVDWVREEKKLTAKTIQRTVSYQGRE